jgi:hypothetical protein
VYSPALNPRPSITACQARLAQEPLAEALVLGQLRGDQLERHRPLQRQVGGAVDHAHPAATDQSVNSVPGERTPTGERCLHRAFRGGFESTADRTTDRAAPGKAPPSVSRNAYGDPKPWW